MESVQKVCVSETDGLDQVKKERRPCIGVLHGPLACEPQGYVKTLQKKPHTHTLEGATFLDCEIEQRVMRGKDGNAFFKNSHSNMPCFHLPVLASTQPENKEDSELKGVEGVTGSV